ncbi:MAG: ABC transporter permease, partial [Bacilli bacterium]|nr:ABC transporter permease [Bacilli bacterium]
NMDYIINFFGGDFDTTEKIYVVDNLESHEDTAFQSFKNYFEAIREQMDLDEYEIVLDNKAMDKKDELEDEVIVVINKSATDYLEAEIVSYDTVSRTTYEIINSTLNTLKSEIVLKTSGMTPEEIAKLTSPITLKETVLNEKAKDNQTKEEISAIITTVIIVPFFLLIVTMVQMLGAEINDEKTSRGMEVIISSIPAKSHFISKVLAAISYVLIQGGLLLSYSVIAVLLRKAFTSADAAVGVGSIVSDTIKMLSEAGIFTMLAQGAIPLIILFIVSFIAYAIVSATLASMTTNNEDFQQLQTPLMIMMLVGYYVALMAVVFDGSIFIYIMAYIPLLSVMIAPTLYLMGEMPLVSLICVTAVTSVVTYFLYVYGLRIY